MDDLRQLIEGFRTPEARWARFGPYYAMFPVDFAFDIIKNYSQEGESIIDPFAGRCSSIFAGGILGRHSLGIEINPVGWLFGTTKLNPANKEEVNARLAEIYNKRNYYSRAIEKMPQFFRMCYCDEVLKFLLSAKRNLDWKNNHVDSTLMSILLVYLHGKLGEGMSNQMKMSKSMGMNYSIEWWRRNKLTKPPEINPLNFIISKLNWRYEKGIPKVADSKVLFGDSTVVLQKILKNSQRSGFKFSLLFTSPPYYAVTNYYADQWLRLWLLGYTKMPGQDKYQGRFSSKEDYYNLLDSVFNTCSKMMTENSTIYVRTDKRKYTFDSTLNVLTNCFPFHKVKITQQPFLKRTQTAIHGNSSSVNGEVDIILTRK